MFLYKQDSVTATLRERNIYMPCGFRSADRRVFGRNCGLTKPSSRLVLPAARRLTRRDARNSFTSLIYRNPVGSPVGRDSLNLCPRETSLIASAHVQPGTRVLSKFFEHLHTKQVKKELKGRRKSRRSSALLQKTYSDTEVTI